MLGLLRYGEALIFIKLHFVLGFTIVPMLKEKVESSANKFSDDHRRATCDAKKALADSYLDVLVSLKEKWEKKKAATDCEDRLREVMENIDLLMEIMNNNLLASDELLRL